MRLLFVCQECAIRYLPPESMRYESAGEDASPVWCSLCQGVMRERGIPEPHVAAAVALLAAKAALRAYANTKAGQEAPEPDSRPSRPARTARARPGPASARSRLH